jgi:hypothetical protein
MTESDQLIQQKLETFREEASPDERTLRYLETIQEYYGRAHPKKQMQRKKYNSVFSMISRMWEISGKSIPEVLEVWRDFEPILQNLETKESYRDHFIHSSNVFLLGYYIINELRRTCGLKGSDLCINDIELAWMMASTFHDVAYPIQEMESWLNNLFLKMLGINPRFDYNITQIVPMAYNEFMKMIADYHLHRENNLVSGRVSYLSMDWSIYDRLNSELINKDHGVLSALMLAHVLAIRKGFATKNDGSYWNFINIHMPAIHAISLHTLKSINVEFNKHPIAFLLVLCDELQDWGRPEKRPRKGIVDLLSLSIVKDNVPFIKIQVKASKKSSSYLAKSLSRLRAKGKIKVSISDKDGNTIVEILDDF